MAGDPHNEGEFINNSVTSCVRKVRERRLKLLELLNQHALGS
jgi:hypothetical protein